MSYQSPLRNPPISGKFPSYWGRDAMLQGNKDWFTEVSFRGSIAQSYKVIKTLHSEQSKFQKIDVVETEALGKLLLLDGKTMVSDLDEFVYHEIMGHISSMTAAQLKKVLIIGGGDGGIVREFTRYPEIEQIDLVEIDERVIEVSKEFFPKVTSGLSDSRVNILPQDGLQFIKTKQNEYDIIIIDSTDPENFAEGLFTTEFYSDVNNALTSNGIMMNQTETPFYDEYDMGKIYSNLRANFPIVESLAAPMPIYPGVYWTFGYCSKTRKPTELNPDRIDFMKNLQKELNWYNMDWHRAAFSISNLHKKIIGKEL